MLLLAGCTVGPGTGYATIAGGELRAAFEPGEARDLGGDRILTNLAYEVQVEALSATIAEFRLEELQGAAGVAFDPANPPEGYTLCHGGHCHSEDGRLVSYAEVEAELAGGTASFEPVASWPGGDLDLLADDVLALDAAFELGAVEVRRAAAHVGTVRVAGFATEGDPFDVELALDTDLVTGVDLAVDRRVEPELAVIADLVAGGTLFDDVDFAVGLDDATLRANLLRVELFTEVIP